MLGRTALDVLHGELQAFFVAVYSPVLRAVVHEGALYIGHQPDEREI